MDLSEVWRRIVGWHEAHVGPEFFRLASGAMEQAIAALEDRLGLPLPADVRASYALHDGAEDEGWLLHFGEFLSLAGIARQLDIYRQIQDDDPEWAGDKPRRLNGPVRPVWWTAHRFPVTDNSGDHALIDLDPAPGGCVGQVVEFDHERGPTRVLATSFAEWLTGLADGLEAGRYVYHPEDDTVAPPDH